MKIGFCLPRTIDGDEIKRFAQSLEDFEFESIWTEDRLIISTAKINQYPYSKDGSLPVPPEMPFLDILTVLTYIAACTTSIKVGSTVVIVPNRNPILQAKIFATMDVLSKGRTVCGVGVGWFEKEFETLGAPYAQRGPMTDEWLTIFKDLWTSDYPEHQGEFYQYDGIRFYPKPVQKPHIPIWVGGHSRRAIRRTVDYGNAWHPSRQTPEWLEKQLPYLRQYAEEKNRNIDEITISLKRTAHFNDIGIEEGPNPAALGTIIGSTSEITDDIKQCQEIGVHQLTYDFRTGNIDQCIKIMEHFANKVVPKIS